MIPVISFVGSSGSGKTTLIESVIQILTSEGFKVSYLKHGYGLELDKEGKDTWRMHKAGAGKVFMISPEKYASIAVGEANLEEMIHKAIDNETDILIIEGYKQSSYPKIEVFREYNGKPLICANDDCLLAIATDTPITTTHRVLDINKPLETAEFIMNYIANYCNNEKISILLDKNRLELDIETKSKLTELLKPFTSKGSNLFEIKININN